MTTNSVEDVVALVEVEETKALPANRGHTRNGGLGWTRNVMGFLPSR
jgi:hypothetical protein